MNVVIGDPLYRPLCLAWRQLAVSGLKPADDWQKYREIVIGKESARFPAPRWN